MTGNKAMRRALETKDAIRIGTNVPLLTDETIWCDAAKAEELLVNNKNNRPINWRKVDEFAEIIKSGQWKIHSQGIMLDKQGNLLTGQTRLWAVIRANTGVWLRVSRGNSSDVANVIDRGRPQSARDLASRKTEQKHSPIEQSIARAICALNGELRPSVDIIAGVLVGELAKIKSILRQTSGTRKSKALLMMLAAIVVESETVEEAIRLAMHSEDLAAKLDHALLPQNADRCWNKGAAFSLAMERARSMVIGSER